MIKGDFTIRISVLENGYTVEVPDLAELKKRETAQAKKQAAGDSCCMPYYGDCTERMIAKTTGEVLSLVKQSLAQLPEGEYADAFEEATKADEKVEPSVK